MALIFNNLIINKNSNRYKPFLFNVISGRRHRLSDDEFNIVCSMTNKADFSSFNNDEKSLFNKLTNNKQFIDDTQRKHIETMLEESGHFDLSNTLDISNDFSFSMQLTQACNMNCFFCYENEYKDVSIQKCCCTQSKSKLSI